MSSDNAMARFLFAILQQKDLRDINWNQVAENPVLAEPISNGHAARMRYFRFRNSMTGHEPRRRKATTPDDSRVTKKRKETKPKSSNAKSSGRASSNQHVATASGNDMSPSIPSPNTIDGRFIAPMPRHRRQDSINLTAASPDMRSRGEHRLMTPFSDSETLASSPQNFSHNSPITNEMLHHHANSPYDFGPVAPSIQDDFAWHDAATSPAYHQPGFVGYDLHHYSPAFVEEQTPQHAADALGVHAAMRQQEEVNALIKSEQWEVAI